MRLLLAGIARDHRTKSPHVILIEQTTWHMSRGFIALSNVTFVSCPQSLENAAIYAG
jgi:hypothetical protein